MSTVTYHLFARHAYADPLALVTSFEHDGIPAIADLPVWDDTWLEVAVLAEEDVTWILRDGELVATIDPATEVRA